MARFDHEQLLRIRLELGLSQQEAADSLGIPVRSYRRYESGAVNRDGFSVRHASRQRLLQEMCVQFGIASPEDWLLSETEAPPPAATEMAAVRGHLLPVGRVFVGREAEQARLSRFVAGGEGEPGVLAVVAMGGMGKTALVAQWLSSSAAALAALGGRCWVWSFYEDERIEAFLAGALSVFSPQSPTAPAGALTERLLSALDGGAGLLVLDGLEVVQAPEGGAGTPAPGALEAPPLRRLLRHVAASAARRSEQVRVLVTSRLPVADLEPWLGQGAAVLRLAPLPVDAVSRALRGWGLSTSAAQAAGRVSGGHALSVAVVGAYVSEVLGGDTTKLSALPLDAGAVLPSAHRLHAVVTAYLEALTPLERDLLARVALLPGGADLATLAWLARSDSAALSGALSGAGPEVLARALHRLRERGLLAEGAAGRFTSHPVLLARFRAMLDAPAATHLQDRLATAFLGKQEGAGEDADPETREALLAALLSADRAEEALALYGRVLGGFGQVGLRDGDWLRGARLTRRFSRTASPADLHPHLSAEGRARLAYDWGLYAGALGDLPGALRAYAAHQEAAASLEGLLRRRALVTGDRTIAYTQRLQGHYRAAMASIMRSLSAAVDGWDQARGLALRAAIAHDLGEVAAAAQGFAAAEALLGHPPVARWGLWYAEHLLERGEPEAAAQAAAQNLSVCVQRGWPGHAAHCRLVLADATSDRAAAETHRAAARGWVAQTGEVELLLRLHLSEARSEEGADHWSPLAEAMGFGWFTDRLRRCR